MSILYFYPISISTPHIGGDGQSPVINGYHIGEGSSKLSACVCVFAHVCVCVCVCVGISPFLKH